MNTRVLVRTACTPRCPACVACPDDPGYAATLEAVLQQGESEELTLGGGDALTWLPLDEFLQTNRLRQKPQKVWIEAPARALGEEALASLAARGVHGIVVLIEAVGEKLIKAMKVADGELVIARAEALGLATVARVAVRPRTLPMVASLALRLSPRPVLLEVTRHDWSPGPGTLLPEPIEKLLLACPNISFSGDREKHSGYLPPCTMPKAWSQRSDIWRSTLGHVGAPNTVLDACADCTLSTRCQWNEPQALTASSQAAATPIKGAIPWETQRLSQPATRPTRSTSEREIICTTPWTTMEVYVSGDVYQCCTTWTNGSRGSLKTMSLEQTWNGEGYRSARRIMSGEKLSTLCNTICPRLHDKAFRESRFEISPGSDAFVRNQHLLLEEIIQRRELLKAKPLYLTIGPSTYCNYDCIMCNHGRTPRKDLDEEIWDELPSLMPTLKTLTLLGGEPLANPRIMKLLREFDAESWPDVRVDLVTNGSLLTAKALSHMKYCAFGGLTISLNAGSAEVYERIMRKGDFQQVLRNIDALLQWRSERQRWFGLSLSLVVQSANADDLVEFGKRALERNLRIRLLPLNPKDEPELDFYKNPEELSRVLAGLDRLAAFADSKCPDWRQEIDACRASIASTARELSQASLVQLSRSARS